ncbi:MAG: TerC family protein [Methanomassiliicoccales archaeon]|nr:TerC family protein [Methanomassiliicoccales archaeon]
MIEDMNLFWVGFFIFIIAMLALDLFVFNRKAHEIGVREAVKLSIFWIALAVAFNVLVFLTMGSQKGLEFTTGYIIELTLSVDNLFVFILVFGYFCTPKFCLHKVLFWGILGALVFRGLFIFVGVALLEQFSWVIYIFGAFLVFTAIRMAFGHDKKIDPKKNLAVRGFRKIFPVTDDYHGDKFWVRAAGTGALMATPLLVTLIFVESTDIVFALDSIPAILAITTDPFIVYTSNAFAILGLRSLFFALSSAIAAFCYLKYGLAVILGFVGVKMLISGFVHIPVWASLAVIGVVLAITVAASLYKNRGRDTCPMPEEK